MQKQSCVVSVLLLWPVSVQHRLKLPVKLNQSLGRTVRSWAQQEEARGPTARGRCLCILHMRNYFTAELDYPQIFQFV